MTLTTILITGIQTAALAAAGCVVLGITAATIRGLRRYGAAGGLRWVAVRVAALADTVEVAVREYRQAVEDYERRSGLRP